MTTPANWHPDPTGRFQLRYWDGAAWTSHVSTNGVTASDPVGDAPPATNQMMSGATYTQSLVDTRVPNQVAQQAGISGAVTGGGTFFTEPLLVVNQKAKLIEITNQYTVFDGAGRQLGSVNEVGQSAARKVLRVLTNVDQFLSHKYEIRDNAGVLQMGLHRPAKFLKSTVIVTNPSGGEIGSIVQQNVIGKINFGLMVGGQAVGAIKAENWRAWNFRIEDATGAEIARVTKTWEGLGKALFTTADNYVVQIHQQLPETLHAMVIAAALCIDTALKQDDT
jgi:uncharacterized protein YxjI